MKITFDRFQTQNVSRAHLIKETGGLVDDHIINKRSKATTLHLILFTNNHLQRINDECECVTYVCTCVYRQPFIGNVLVCNDDWIRQEHAFHGSDQATDTNNEIVSGTNA